MRVTIVLCLCLILSASNPMTSAGYKVRRSSLFRKVVRPFRYRTLKVDRFNKECHEIIGASKLNNYPLIDDILRRYVYLEDEYHILKMFSLLNAVSRNHFDLIERLVSDHKLDPLSHNGVALKVAENEGDLKMAEHILKLSKANNSQEHE